MRIFPTARKSGIDDVELAAPAKLNLFLEVLGRRSDGFHELDTIMTTVSIADRIRFSKRNDDAINLKIINPPRSASARQHLPTDDRNLVVKALQRLREVADPQHLSGCDVWLQKNIPAEAGLGGASSDAAAALVAGRKIWKLDLSNQQLLEIAAELGSDVPFFLYGGMARCRGRGEIVNPIKCPARIPVVIAKPKIGLSTPNVYGKLVVPTTVMSGNGCQQSVIQGSCQRIAKSVFNRLQQVAEQLTDQIARLRQAFSMVGCPGHQMSGSGTSYFGIFPTWRMARQASRVLSNRLPETRIIYTSTLGSRAVLAHQAN